MNYVKSLAKQLASKGIRVNGVAPGPIWTPLQISGGATMEKLEKFGGRTSLGRPGQPAELASIYVQLAAEDGSYAKKAARKPPFRLPNRRACAAFGAYSACPRPGRCMTTKFAGKGARWDCSARPREARARQRQ
jgi:hypothetical protein